ncbi:MAG: argininosuccinate lyase [Gemmataceae bacterium]|nr:argininosuccinate lyase [Gemmataceae bacterium]
MTQKTWGGRFSEATDKRVEAFTESISYDHRLYRQDIQASQAHTRMLAAVGLLSQQEAEQIVTALEEIGQDIAAGRMPWQIELEDIHTHIERALIARLGDLGRKLHTARSRNDQVVTDVKLWVREAIDQIDSRLEDLQRAFVRFAEREESVILPGYTHLQRAQPVLASHYALAYVEKWQRDRDRLAEARRRLNVLPLGAAALAGTSLPIDRDMVRRELGFAELAANSMDVSSDRDFVLDYVYALAVLAVHLSGWAEEWIIWSTTEFSFLELPDAFCTGSSIMPHKKNPDVLELIRGRSARVIAALQQLFVLLKGLPLAYNRDLQEDKIALFTAHDTVNACLEVAIPLVEGSRLRRDSITARLEDGFLDATTLMEGLVEMGVPLRAAHEAVGRLVQECEQRRCRLAELPEEVFQHLLPQHLDDSGRLRSRLGTAAALAAFRSHGSTAPAEVKKQLQLWKQRLRLDPAQH